MQVVQLTAENVMRLTAVSIHPAGHVVTIGGKNGHGKSSVLNAIAMALGGKALCPERPVHEGADKGMVSVDLGEFVVTRTFTAGGGGSLKVENKDGARYPSPQAMLDKLIGSLSFDPLAFTEMKPAEQREVLRQLVGLDFSDLETERKEIEDERLEDGRKKRNLHAQIEAIHERLRADQQRGLPIPDDLVSVEALTAELEAADVKRDEVVALERARQHAGQAVSAALDEIDRATRDIKRLDDQIVELTRQKAERAQAREALKAALPGQQRTFDEAREALVAAESQVPDVAAIRARIRDAQGINERVLAKRQAEQLGDELAALQARYDAQTSAVREIEQQKADRIKAAPFPVPGLSLTDAGVTLNGLPFEQASKAEQIRASVAIGLAANPKLRVLLVHDGSLLDDDSMRLLAQIAAEHDAQVWVERVTADPTAVQVFIEEGAVKETTHA